MSVRNPRGREGQTLVLSCLTMLALSLAILATVNLGHVLHERIRLQNTADAAAYSMAAAEARAFNLYAFANRAQASHYVSAMLFQSTLSFLFFEEAFLTDAYGVMLTLEPCAASPDLFWQVACPVLRAVPGVGPVLRFIEASIGVFGALVEAYQQALRRSGADEVIGRGIIPGLRTLSSGMALVSGVVMGAALAQVAGTAGDVIAANDPDVDATASQPLTGGLSACLFDRAHFRESFGSPLAPGTRPGAPLPPRERREQSKQARAKRAMGQVANASRYACDGGRHCPERFVTARTADLAPLPGSLGPISGFLASLPKWGQTRMLSHELARGWDDPLGGNLIREPLDTPDAPSSMLAQGDALGADDLYELGLPGDFGRFVNPFACDSSRQAYWECWGEPRRGFRDSDGQRPFRYMMKTSVWALDDDERAVHPGGIHWRVAFPNGYPAGPGHVEPSALQEPQRRRGLNDVPREVAPGVWISMFVANVRPIEDGNHRWRGVAPFPHFEPGQFAESCLPAALRNGDPSLSTAASRKDEFNQPSAWVALEKGPAALRNLKGAISGAGTNRPALLNAGGRLQLTMGTRHADLVMEDRGEQLRGLGFAPGLNVLARAQAYYHRPGNWAEQPNFFNPYWRPRLASVHQGRDAMPLVRALEEKLPPELRGTPQKALTH